MAHRPQEYVAIKMWGERMGSAAYYIDEEQQRAAREGAPLNAIYKRYGMNGPESWACVSDLDTEHSFRKMYEGFTFIVKEGFQVYWRGQVLKPLFQDAGAAIAYLDGLRAGRKPV